MRFPKLCLGAAIALAGPPRSTLSQSPPQWKFTEELRIGSDADDASGFSDIRGLLVDRKGNVWVLEYSTKDIRVFDPSGKHLRTIGRSGKGPGEFTYPDGMAMGPDGLIWVHDPQSARFSIFDQSGSFVRQQLAPTGGYGYVWRGGIDRQGRIWDQLIGGYDPKNPWLSRMRRATADWSRVDTLVIPPCQVPGASPEAGGYRFPRGSMGIPFFASPVSALDYNHGVIWCAPRGMEYEFFRIAIEKGDTTARIRSQAQPVPVAPDERDTAIAQIKRFMERAGATSIDYSLIPRVKPLLLAAAVDDDGRLWVRRSSAGKNAVFDLYSPEGKPLATLAVPYPVTRWQRPVTRGQTVYFLTQEEGELPYVVRGRIGPTS